MNKKNKSKRSPGKRVLDYLLKYLQLHIGNYTRVYDAYIQIYVYTCIHTSVYVYLCINWYSAPSR